MRDEEGDEGDVDGGRDENDVRGCAEEALRLEEAAAGFEDDGAGDGGCQDLEVESGEAGGGGVGDEVDDDGLGQEPESGDGDGDAEEEEGHALAVEADEMFFAGAVGLGAEGVEAGG